MCCFHLSIVVSSQLSTLRTEAVGSGGRQFWIHIIHSRELSSIFFHFFQFYLIFRKEGGHYGFTASISDQDNEKLVVGNPMQRTHVWDKVRVRKKNLLETFRYQYKHYLFHTQPWFDQSLAEKRRRICLRQCRRSQSWKCVQSSRFHSFCCVHLSPLSSSKVRGTMRALWKEKRLAGEISFDSLWRPCRSWKWHQHVGGTGVRAGMCFMEH